MPKVNKCERCGCTESHESNCDWLSKPMLWCSRCGYIMQDLEDLKTAMRESGIPVFDATIQLPEEAP